MGRRTGTIIIILITSAILGSGISTILSRFFPEGPVYKILCQIFSVGIKNLTLNLGFFELSFSFTLSVSGLTILFIILAIILLIKF
ncbi:MAG: DUF4321 domain-containing protein [candidate division WOR-3 bacterium]|nr:DUF4321 domain-containing protein [candidate division WOR-3 bacterium]MCX7757599.1 DUF4321 domain-containing protein [candidate division WOR-3 bacterium]MDW7987285.1 DUF4321 domain-containing protein [candidate division WOR-3 bacterium]